MPERFRLALRARARTPFQQRPDYDLLLNGSVVGEVYFNMTGYVGTLPQQDGSRFTLEKKASAVTAPRSPASTVRHGKTAEPVQQAVPVSEGER